MSSAGSAVHVPRTVELYDLGQQRYEDTFEAMRSYTDARDGDDVDQFWLTEHPPVFTQGQAGKAEHLLAPGNIPVVQSDRGGQVTYHGPGQIVGYLLFDLRRLGLGVRALVSGIEDAIIAVLDRYGLAGGRRDGAPGVYIGTAKIAALGLRVRRGCSYHGLSLNVDMDLEPFRRINPCGLTDVAVTQLKDQLGSDLPPMSAVKAALLEQLERSYDVRFVARTTADIPRPPASPLEESVRP